MLERRCQDCGETLVEVLIALVIMGTSITALLAGLATASRSALLHRDQSDIGTFLLQSADVVKGAPYEQTCSTAPYQSALAAVTPATWTSRGGTTPVTTVQYWDPLTRKFSGSCPAASADSFLKLQLVTVRIDAPNGRYSQTINVAKRYLS